MARDRNDISLYLNVQNVRTATATPLQSAHENVKVGKDRCLLGGPMSLQSAKQSPKPFQTSRKTA